MRYYAVIDTNVLVSAMLKFQSVPGQSWLGVHASGAEGDGGVGEAGGGERESGVFK